MESPPDPNSFASGFLVLRCYSFPSEEYVNKLPSGGRSEGEHSQGKEDGSEAKMKT